jgi:hypothetical protein
VVLFSPLDIVEEPGDDRGNKERREFGAVDAPAASLDENNSACVPCHGLAVAKPVSALQLRFVQPGVALANKLIGPEHVLGTAHGVRVLAVEEGSRQGSSYSQCGLFESLIERVAHATIIDGIRERCQDEFSQKVQLTGFASWGNIALLFILERSSSCPTSIVKEY